MQRTLIGVLLALPCCLAFGDVVIRMPEQASNDIRFVAEDLRWHLQEMTGGKESLTIELGTEIARERALSVAGSLKNGESAVVGAGDCVYIWGAGDKGMVNGVYRFLEKGLGCRWLTAWDKPYIPKRERLSVGAFVDVNRPGLAYRWLLTAMGSAQLPKNGSLFLYRNRSNTENWKYYGNVALPRDTLPLRPEFYCPHPMCHSMFFYVPKERFKDHPEWFSMDRKGVRQRDMQFCFSSKALRETYTKAFLDNIARNDGTGVFDLSQTDEHGDGFCWCPACSNLTERYGTPAAPLLVYLKELGTKVAARYPNALIKFLCYRKTQTQHPPNEAFGKLPDNIIPVLAPVDDDFAKGLNAPVNTGTLANFKRWRSIAQNVWVWYYPLPYGDKGLSPFSSIWRWSGDLETLTDAGLTGAQFEHSVGYSTGINTADLQAWLILKKYEHPHADVKRLTEEFCRCYYGAAKGEMLEYVSDLERISHEYDKFLVWNSYIPKSFTVDNLIRWNTLFEHAESKLGGDMTLLQHVREMRVGLDLHTLKKYEALRRAGLTATPSDIYNRLSETLEKAYERRAPGDAKKSDFCPPNRGFDILNKQAKLHYNLANGGMKPLPPHLAKYPEEDVVQLFNAGGGSDSVSKTAQVRMPDAASGYATANDGDSKDSKGFHVGYYDRANGKFGESVRIPQASVGEEGFSFYRVGEVVPSQCGYVFIGNSCLVRTYLDECYEPAVAVKWDLWVSLKREGDMIWYDRLVVIRKR